MPLSDDREAHWQMDVEERQVGDTAENQRGVNTKTQFSGMSAHFLMSSFPHLSSSRELWRSFWKAVVHVPNRG